MHFFIFYFCGHFFFGGGGVEGGGVHLPSLVGVLFTTQATIDRRRIEQVSELEKKYIEDKVA